MKAVYKKTAALLLIVALCMSLAACGDSAAPTSTPTAAPTSSEAETPEYVYVSNIKELSRDEKWINVLTVTDTGFYFIQREVVGQRELYEGEELTYEGQLDVYENKLKFYDFDGNVSALTDYEPYTVDLSEFGDNVIGGERYNSISLLMLSGDDIVIIEDDYGYCYDNTPGVEMYSDEWYMGFHSKEEYYIRHLDKTGKEISTVKIDPSVFNSDYFYISNSKILDNGSIIFTCDQMIYLIGQDGSLIASAETDGWIDNLITLKDGRVCAFAYFDSYGLYEINTETLEFSNENLCNVSAYNFVDGVNGDYDFYYSFGSNFFGYDIEKQSAEKLFNWIACDVNYENLTGYCIGKDGTILCVANEYNSSDDSYAVSVVNIEKKPASEVPKKETLTLACQYADSNIINQAISFNRSHDNVRINVIDYSEYNTEDDYSAGLTKLTTEILSGQMPDILALNGLPVSQLISKGYLENLYPYLDSDAELSRDSIVPGVLKALENSGGIYYTTPCFYIKTLVGASNIVGEQPGWSYGELYEALEKMPEGCDVLDQYTTRDSILYSCLYQCIDRYVDWNTGEVNFNSSDFIELLKFANSFPSEYDWENYEYAEDDSTQSRIMQGKQMLVEAFISDFYDTTYYGMYFGGNDNVTFIGYPTADGSSYGSTITLENGLAVSSRCEHKDLAWQFVRTLFTEEYQSGQYGLPTNAHSFDKKIDEARKIEYEKNADGTYRLDENGEKIPVVRISYWISEDNSYDIYNLSDTETARLMDLVNNTTTLAGNDEELYNIVLQEAEAFFAGQKSAEDVANLIQSKLSIYINEKR